MASQIPTSNSVLESAVIDAPLTAVWHLIKLHDFVKFWSKLSASEFIRGASEEAEIVKWTFKDGTVYELKQEEHSAINHFITYSIISCEPALNYTSMISTIRLYPVTCGEHQDSTFVTWSANFSSDADAEIVEDAKFKRREALADLASAAAKK